MSSQHHIAYRTVNVVKDDTDFHWLILSVGRTFLPIFQATSSSHISFDATQPLHIIQCR